MQDLVESYQHVDWAYLPYYLLWLLACLIVLVTAVYTLRHRNEPAQLLTVKEKLVPASYCAILGVVSGFIGIAGEAFFLNLNAFMFDGYVVFGVPFLILLAGQLQEKIHGKKVNTGVWVFFSIVNAILIFSPEIGEFIFLHLVTILTVMQNLTNATGA